jgi:hypothetical protein
MAARLFPGTSKFALLVYRFIVTKRDRLFLNHLNAIAFLLLTRL